MYLPRRVKFQLAAFTAVTVVAAAVMAFGYGQFPQQYLGMGRYSVVVQLPVAAGLYERANVTYRGVEVGEVTGVGLTDSGVTATLSLRSDIPIPADLTAEVHSVSAIGEQYVALLPHQPDGAVLADGDVIPADRTTVPPDINTLLDATNRGLEAIPGDDLRTAIDEASTGLAGLGPELGRLINGSTRLASDSRANLDSLTTLIDESPTVLDSQTDTAASITLWAAQIADFTAQLRDADPALAGVMTDTGPAAQEATELIDRLAPTLPVLLANLTSLGRVAIAYRAGLEQILVLFPAGIASGQATFLPNRWDVGPARGATYMSMNLNTNLPPPCQTGYLPAAQRRVPAEVDSPARSEGKLYCRVPQDSPFNVRGARNIPCQTKPGKRAPTAAMCESDEVYVPLNDGYNWKGDPNATLSGQDIPQMPPQAGAGPEPAAPAPAAPIAAVPYDPATGSFVGPDGKVYTQADLARDHPQERTWQSMLTPPGS